MPSGALLFLGGVQTKCRLRRAVRVLRGCCVHLNAPRDAQELLDGLLRRCAGALSWVHKRHDEPFKTNIGESLAVMSISLAKVKSQGLRLGCDLAHADPPPEPVPGTDLLKTEQAWRADSSYSSSH